MPVQRTVFISYRRTNMYMARAVYLDLRAHGYDAFLDMERLDSGDFSQGLLEHIAARAHFVLILTPSALERCTSPDDWVRQEIEYAIETQRNIVPLLFEGFKFEQVGHFLASDKLKLLPKYNGLPVPDEYFDEAMERLRGTRYLDRALETVLHPAAPNTQSQALSRQREADAAPPPTPQQREAEQLFERGFRKSRLMSDYDGAIEDFTRAIELKPDYVEAYYRRGNAYYGVENKIEALGDWKIAMRLAPDDKRVNIIGSSIASAERDLNKALAEAEAGVKLNPDYDDAYFRRGNARAANTDYYGALADYDEAIRLNPQFAFAYNNRGNVRADIQEFDKAIADYDEAIRLNPQFASAYNNRGIARVQKKDYAEAVTDFESVLRIKPNHTRARNHLESARRLKDKGW